MIQWNQQQRIKSEDCDDIWIFKIKFITNENSIFSSWFFFTSHICRWSLFGLLDLDLDRGQLDFNEFFRIFILELNEIKKILSCWKTRSMRFLFAFLFLGRIIYYNSSLVIHKKQNAVSRMIEWLNEKHVFTWLFQFYANYMYISHFKHLVWHVVRWASNYLFNSK